jgi:hypothetical protein
MLAGIVKIAIILSISLAAYPSHAQLGEASHDQRVKTQLDKLGINYSITEHGDFKVIFEMDNDRTQMVFIESNTNKYEGMEIREVKSIAAIKNRKSEYTQPLLLSLLELNQTYKLGAWQIHGGEEPYILQFAIRLSANATQTVLDDSIRLAAYIADEMEKEITNQDDY